MYLFGVGPVKKLAALVQFDIYDNTLRFIFNWKKFDIDVWT